MLGAVRHEDGSGGSRQITHARLPQSGEEIVPEFGERGRRHRRTEARRNVQVFLAARNWFAVCVEEDDFQAASRTDDDAVFEDARRLKRSRGKAAREGGKEDRQRNEAEKKARCKRGRRAPAARRISVSHIPVPIGQRPAPFFCAVSGAGAGVSKERDRICCGAMPQPQPIRRRTSRFSTGSNSFSNHGFFLIQALLRHEGCGSGRKRG